MSKGMPTKQVKFGAVVILPFKDDDKHWVLCLRMYRWLWPTGALLQEPINELRGSGYEPIYPPCARLKGGPLELISELTVDVRS